MKTYSKPELYIEDLQTIDMLALSIKDGQADENKDVLGNSRRGTWGDLWADED